MSLFDIFKKDKKSNINSSELSKGKNPKIFDYNKEKYLLDEYNKRKNNKDKSGVYYSALPLISFYYKFRNLDNKYLDECIKYCNICISCLSSSYMKPYLDEGAYVPVFKRLWIIYINKKQYDKALFIADEALKYNQDKEYFCKKKQEIIKKEANKNEFI